MQVPSFSHSFLRRATRRAVCLLCVTGMGFVAATASRAADGAKPDLPALRQQATAFEHGEGVPKDPKRAAELYCEAAREGDAEAQYALGWMHANGRGIARDDALAAYFFALAADQGHAFAQKMQRFVSVAAAPQPDCMKKPEPEDDGFENATDSQRQIVDLVRRIAPEYGVHPRLALAVIRTESGFNPGAVSNKNAQGLMQLIPETSRRFNVKKPFDPEQNVRGGLSYLRWLLAYFKGDVTLVAAAYNAGEGAVNQYRGIPPYAETREYVKRIRAIFRKQDHPYDESVTLPSPEMPRIAALRKTG